MPQNMVHLKLVPRIDYGRKRGALRDDEDRKRPAKRRAPQKLFDEVILIRHLILLIRIKLAVSIKLELVRMPSGPSAGSSTRTGTFSSSRATAIGQYIIIIIIILILLILYTIYRRGFLYKAFPLSAIIVEGVKPTLGELEKFQVNE